MGALFSKGVRKISRLGVSENLESAVAKELDEQKLRYKPESLDLLEFASELSMFTKGTLEQRLEWLFNLYDIAKKGFITEDDYLTVCRAMYCLVGVHYYKDKQIPIVLRRHIRHQNSIKIVMGKLLVKTLLKAAFLTLKLLNH
uniref:EF-hand domain-containing protein n=1 Tax=Heterorhabditis bacteriophora TaxID=37862 RepID=A0A1I7XMA4_HETBA